MRMPNLQGEVGAPAPQSFGYHIQQGGGRYPDPSGLLRRSRFFCRRDVYRSSCVYNVLLWTEASSCQSYERISLSIPITSQPSAESWRTHSEPISQPDSLIRAFIAKINPTITRSCTANRAAPSLNLVGRPSTLLCCPADEDVFVATQQPTFGG